MKRIPPEIDQLMWDIAEQADAQALDQFEVRYPEFKLELAKRITMVRGLKAGGRRTERIPAFHLRPQPAPAPIWTSPRAFAFSMTLVLAAIGVAAFTVTTFLSRPTTTVKAPEKLEPKVERFVQPKTPETSQKTPEVVPSPNPATVEPPVDATPRYLRPQTLALRSAPLGVALQAIAAAGGLKLEIAPGLPTVDVVLDFRDKTPVEMLQELGNTYAFTAFEQGPGQVLIIPAVESGKAPPDTDEQPKAKPAEDHESGTEAPNG